MGSIEELAKAVALGLDCENEPVRVRRHEDGFMYVYRFETVWCGSVAEWQSALLAALSAMFVDVVSDRDKHALVITPPNDLSFEEKARVHSFGMDFSRETRRQIVVQAFVDPHYPQLTDWVRAQPSGASLLVAIQDDENEPAIQKGDNDGKLLAYVNESEFNETLSCRDWSAVWLSRHVSTDCESKIPRGVKVYRER